MMCTQPPAQPSRQFVYRGAMNSFKAADRFRGRMPLNSELDGPVRTHHRTGQPAELSKAGSKLIHTDTLLLYPEEGHPFPGLFEFHDHRSGRFICMDTLFCKGERRIALVLEGDYDFTWDRDRMLLLPKVQPIMLEAFPQRNGWYKCEENTRIPVEDSQASGQSRVQPELFLERERGPWAGRVARSTNAGNHDELYLYAFGSPVVDRAVFTIEAPQLAVAKKGGAADGSKRRVPRRRMVAVPVSAPVQKKEEPKPEPGEKPRSYAEISREYQIEMARFLMDPRNCLPPEPIPSYDQYMEMLGQGKTIH